MIINISFATINENKKEIPPIFFGKTFIKTTIKNREIMDGIIQHLLKRKKNFWTLLIVFHSLTLRFIILPWQKQHSSKGFPISFFNSPLIV